MRITIKKYYKLLITITAVLLLSQIVVAQSYTDGYLSAVVNIKKAVNGGDTVPVLITIDKKNISGFAKFKSFNPPDVSVVLPDYPNASTTVKDTTLEILWVEIPYGSTFTIRYSIVVPPDIGEKVFQFSANFYYLIDKEVKVLKMSNITFEVTHDANKVKGAQKQFTSVAKNEQNVIMPKQELSGASQLPKDTTTKPAPSAKIEIQIPLANNEVPVKKEAKGIETPKAPKVAPSEAKNDGTGVQFKVQIAASKVPINTERLKHLYSGDLPVQVKQCDDGWIRYMIGQFKSIAEAKNLKGTCGVSDAFVRATKDGEIIKVSEALQNKPKEEQSYGKIIYAVQVIALKKYVSLSTMKDMFSIDKLIFIEKDKDLYKYLVGYFFSFKEASEYKTTLKQTDAFVVSYINGKRLEAIFKK